MDRLIGLEPSNVVIVRIEAGNKCSGELTLRNVMYTMPVAFRLSPGNKNRYTVRPQSGIVSPLNTVTLEIIYHPPPGTLLPETFPHSGDSFLLHSAVAPGAAAVKDAKLNSESLPNDWFSTKKKQVFIDSGIKIMFVGSPVLAAIVSNGNMDEIREVLEKSDPSWKAADAVDGDGQSLLHLAIAQSRADLVQLLLEFGPDLAGRSRASGSSPLEAAVVSGESLIVEILLANRACTEKTESSAWGPIHHAAGNGHVDILRLLLLKGANVNALTKNGETALHLAVEEKRKDCARLLLASGARADIRAAAGDGNTPLHIAAGNGDEHMVRLLLQKGAEKNIRNKYGKTAYDVAAENGHSRLFDALRLFDSLCAAARKGDVRTIQKLLDHGANVNGRDQNGWTALHRASSKGKTEAARALIDNGVDVNGRDEEGYTALHCAVESGHVDVTELLVKKGADVDTRTNKGVTALQIAESLHFSGITRILVQGGVYKDVNSNRVNSNLITLSEKGIYKEKMEMGTKKKKAIGARVGRGVPLAVV